MIRGVSRFAIITLTIFAADQLSKLFIIKSYNIDVTNLTSKPPNK